MIRTVKLDDAQQLSSIYNYYIENTVITFEEVPVSDEEMKYRIEKVTESYPWFVYEVDGKIIGYTYASEWKKRGAYRFSAEATIYIDINYKGCGIGTALYRFLIDNLKDKDIHSVIGGIAFNLMRLDINITSG